jgi:hypothetical protein
MAETTGRVRCLGSRYELCPRPPYRQGDLDGLCGVYALVNAVKLVVGPVSLEQGLGLVEDCLVNLSQRLKWPAGTQGLGINQMIGLIRDGSEAQLSRELPPAICQGWTSLLRPLLAIHTGIPWLRPANGDRTHA